MIKSPSVQSTNKSLFNIENYNKEFINSINTYSKNYLVHIKDLLELIHKCSDINSYTYFKFITLRGVECVSHIYNILLLYTKNQSITNYHCNKAIHYFIEFISQIGNDSHSFLQLNTKDAMLFVYKKTIFDINNDYRKEYTIDQHTTIYTNVIRKFTTTVNSLVNIILNYQEEILKNSNKSYTKTMKIVDKLYKPIENIYDKPNNITSFEKFNLVNDNIAIVIEKYSLKQYPIQNFIYIEALLKKLHKSNIETEHLKFKLNSINFDEIHEDLTIQKFTKFLLD